MLVLLLTWGQQGLPSHISYSLCSPWGIKEHLLQQRSSQNAGRFAQTNMCSSKFKYLDWKGSKWVSPSQSVPSLQEYTLKKLTSLVLQLPPNTTMGRVLQTVLHDENKFYSTLCMPWECLLPCTSLKGKGKTTRKKSTEGCSNKEFSHSQNSISLHCHAAQLILTHTATGFLWIFKGAEMLQSWGGGEKIHSLLSQTKTTYQGLASGLNTSLSSM